MNCKILAGGLEGFQNQSEEGRMLALVLQVIEPPKASVSTLGNIRRVRQRRAGLGARAQQPDCPVLLLKSCALLSKFLNLAVPRFPNVSKHELGLNLSPGAAAGIK